MWVHQQHGATAVVQIVADVLVVNLGRELVVFAWGFVVDTRCQLPALLGLDVQVGEFPDVGRRHDGCVRHLMYILVHGVESGLDRQVLLQRIFGRESQLRGVVGLEYARFVACLYQRLFRWQLAVLIMVHVARTHGVEQRVAQSGRNRQLIGYRALVLYVGSTLKGLLLFELGGGYARLLAYGLVLTGLHVVVLHHQSVVQYLVVVQTVAQMYLAPQLVDAEAQSGSHRWHAGLLVVIVVVVESGRECSRGLLAQHRAPLGRYVTVLIAVVIVRTERELILAPITEYLESVHAVKLPCKHAAKVVEVGITVLVAALFGQLLQYPVAVGGTTVKQQRHVVFYDRYLEVGLTCKQSDAGRTGQLLHVSLLRVHLEHTAYAAAVFRGDARLKQFYIFYGIRVERGEQSEQMRGVVYRAAVEEYQVLVGGATTYVVSARGLAHGGYTGQRQHYLHDVRLAKGRWDVLQYLGLEFLRAHYQALYGALSAAHNYDFGQLLVVGHAHLGLLHARHHIHLGLGRSCRLQRVAIQHGYAGYQLLLVYLWGGLCGHKFDALYRLGLGEYYSARCAVDAACQCGQALLSVAL